ncbi:MAG: hypothetical protein R2696_03730 [Microthrixaceae bacterium]
MPGHADLAVWVSGLEESEELLGALLIETFVALGQQPARSVERVVFAASVPERLVLHPTTALVEAAVRELAHVERISDLGRVGQRVVERLAVRPRQVQRPQRIAAPRLRAGLQPRRGRLRGAALDHIEQLRRTVEGDDRRAPTPGLLRAGPGEERLIQPESFDGPDAGRVLDQRGAVGTDGVHDGVPIAAELNSDVGDGAAITTDPGSHVSTRTIGHLRPRRRDPSIDLGERLGLTIDIRTTPAALVPHQHCSTTERRKVHQRDLASVLHPRFGPA